MKIKINSCELKAVLKKFKALNYKHVSDPIQKSLYIETTTLNEFTPDFVVGHNSCCQITVFA